MANRIERLENQFDKLSRITSSEKGITRLAFSDADWEGRTYVIKIMSDLGLETHIDAFGNIFGHLETELTDSTLPTILVGSHIDSVPQGGNYDGVAGVLAGIEVLRYFKDHNEIKNPLEVVIFANEEGSRFGAATLGSRALIGELTQTDLEKLKDKNGNTLRSVLTKRNLQPDRLGSPLYNKAIKAFFEIHIEQGRVLEELNCPLGVVTGIAAPTRFTLSIEGRSDHSGATPMIMRQDALVGAAEVILSIENFAKAQISPPVVATVGTIDVPAGAMNVIPGKTEIGIDIRSISREAKTLVIQQIEGRIKEVCQNRNLIYNLQAITDEEPVMLPQNIIDTIVGVCKDRQEVYHLMPSGAGHDAMNMAQITDTGMLFIPCKDGISHNAAEFAEVENLDKAIEVLIDAIKRL